MRHADPWNEINRLESQMEADLLAAVERAKLHDSAESFCTEVCRVDCQCPLHGALKSRGHCPLFMYVRMRPSQA